MVIAGTVLIMRRPNKHLPPGDDSPGGRLIGGLVMFAFGLVVGYIGLDLSLHPR